MHHLKVTSSFFIVDCGRRSISTAMGRLRPEIRPPIERATTVFYSYFVDNYRVSSLHPFDVISVFIVAENGGKTISAARGRVRPKMTSPFDFLTQIWYRSALDFIRLSFIVQKIFDVVYLLAKCTLKVLGKKYFP
jgi:hypothetical protein